MDFTIICAYGSWYRIQKIRIKLPYSYVFMIEKFDCFLSGTPYRIEQHFGGRQKDSLGNSPETMREL